MSLDNLQPDEYQQPIISMSAERTAIVKGVAGSGKSLILLKKAKQVSTITRSYAIIVYTKSLKQFFVDELKEIDPTGNHVYYLYQWKNRRHNIHFDYLFVDEAQDFNADEIKDFMAHGKYCWFFGDTNQSIMDFPDHPVQSIEDTEKQLGVKAHDLAINHRLTIENAKVGEHIFPQTHLSWACFKHGPKPSLIQSDNSCEKIFEYISNTGNTNIGIICYTKKQVYDVRDYLQARGIPVQSKTKDYMDLDFNTTSPKILTWHCAKGLQFDTLFIPFCESSAFTEQIIREIYIKALYVATSRPLTKMFILYNERPYSALPDINSTIYERPIKKEVDNYELPF